MKYHCQWIIVPFDYIALFDSIIKFIIKLIRATYYLENELKFNTVKKKVQRKINFFFFVSQVIIIF